MTHRDNILQELNELQSSLARLGSQNVYSVPIGYFEKLANEILNRIKALDTEDPVEELGHLSSLVSGISKEMPYSVPLGFFSDVEARLQAIMKGVAEQTPDEELRALSPLLSGLKKEMPYSVPQGFFEKVENPVFAEAAKPAARVFSITRQKWFRYAAAAVVTGFFAVGGYLFLHKKASAIPVNNSFEWVKYNVRKVSTNDIDKFVNLTDEQAPVIASVEATNSAKDKKEVEDLIKDVPDKDIQNFLDDAVTDNADASDDALMN